METSDKGLERRLTAAGHGDDREARPARARAESGHVACRRGSPGGEARRVEGAVAEEEARGGRGGDDGRGRPARGPRPGGGGSHGRLGGHGELPL